MAQERQQSALSSLSIMDGMWRGKAWIILPTGERQDMTQTERVGPLLNGEVKVIEGRGYDKDGKTVFNALAVIAHDAQQQKLMMRSYTQGRSGDFEIKVQESGYVWEIPAGPATIRYTAEIKDGKWFEYGERLVGDRPPVRFFEMTLERLGDSEWPAVNAVPLK